MSLSSHITELKKKHEELSTKVASIQNYPSTDPLAVAELKKQKLKLKEEISRLS
ncbi:MAG: DUF465 domain-containing protein [Rhodobacteraceae bacterium]|nr:MAG: DUF465 domain-containing protein [Paracoccaceae bacterium]